MDGPQVYRPIPRRAFDISPASNESSVAPSPVIEPQPERLNSFSDKWPAEGAGTPLSRLERLNSVSDKWGAEGTGTPLSRTRSILNLTSGALLGIYSSAPSGGNREDLSTPWGTGAQTPAHRNSAFAEELRADLLAAKLSNDAQRLRAAMKNRKKTIRNYYMPLFLQTAMLFLFGIAFGMLVTQIQRTQKIAPVPVPLKARNSWYYHIAWGLCGVIIGNVLPRIDMIFDDDEAIEEVDMDFKKSHFVRSRSTASDMNEHDRRSLMESGLGPLWHSTVRSIGAFVGIAFAVRKVPWQSTLQVSLTLAIANPVLWYVIDRSKSGFALSTAVGVVGTLLLLMVNPDFVPIPAIHHDQVTDQMGVYAWLASILFCTSLCFGAIGRKLQI